MSLKGKVAIVVGGSRGLEKQVVRRFVEAGAKVVFTARGEGALKKVEEKLLSEKGYQVSGVKADVSNLADSKRVVDFTVEKFGGPDILVNNAAVFPGSTGLEMTEGIRDKHST